MSKENSTNQKKERMSSCILIVDDEQLITSVIAEIVTDLGYKASIAFNGQEALISIHQHWPDLIITDFMMPLMNGGEFIHEVRLEAETQHVPPPPIILLTAVGTDFLHNLHTDMILSKPFDLTQIEESLLNFLHTSSE